MRWVIIFALVTATFMACNNNTSSDRSGGAGVGGNPNHSGIDAGTGGIDINLGNTDSGTTLKGTIKSDGTGELTVSGSPSSIHFVLEGPDGQPIDGVKWSTDDTRIGSIGADGTFTANGYVGGVVVVIAQVGSGTLRTEYTVNVDITENPGNLSPADQTALETGGDGDSSFRFLYPYDGTVFPRGVTAPILQFDSEAAQASYLKISAPHFNYEQFAGASTPTRVTLPEPVWRGLTLTLGAADTATVAMSQRSGDGITGPIEQTWRIAPADLKGIVYYSTYNYENEQGQKDGAIMRILPGQDAEVVQSGCTVCHTVSANGNVLASGVNYWANDDPPDIYNPTDSATFDLDENGGVTQRFSSPEGRLFAFLGLTPDGAMGLVSGIPADRWPPFISRGVRSTPGYPSFLVDTFTGEEIAAPSLSALVSYAQTPAFSPDGKHVAFVNADRLDKRVLSVMDFDGSVSPPVFSNLRDVVTTNGTTVAWPTFLPDGKAVVYHEGDSFDSSEFKEPATVPSGPQYAELKLVDVATGAINPLHALNGRTLEGEFYLPYGGDEEGRMNYEASVLPVAVGGYYWVLFTSRRAYGNTISPGGTVPGGDDPWGTEATPSSRKKIWIAAIDVDYSGADPSHPAFYLPGQGLEAGNMRGFAALAPCAPNGSSCESGSDCCEGFCRETERDESGTPVLRCVPPPDTCSNVDERCSTAADCCESHLLCINNRCSLPSPPR